jgi:hypothetical protein
LWHDSNRQLFHFSCNAFFYRKTVVVDEIVRRADITAYCAGRKQQMKRTLVALVLPGLLAFGSLGLGVALTAAPAGATENAHATMDHTWHGTITKINAKMGTTSSFSFKKGTETYVVHWDAMTHFVMGTAKNIKVGALVTVTGTVKGMIITGTKLDV